MGEAELYERIEDYLKGRLPDEERQAFEREIGADPALAGEVDLQRELMEATADADALEFRRLLEEVGREEIPPASGSGGRRGWLWGLGALLVIVIAIGLWQWTASEAPPVAPQEELPTTPIEATPSAPEQEAPAAPSEERPIATPIPPTGRPSENETAGQYLALAETYYVSPDAEFSALRGAGEQPAGDPVREAAAAFVGKNYRQALRLAENAGRDHPAYWTSRRIAGHAAFQLQNYARAIALFREIATGAPPEFAEPAQGDLLLSYLAAGRTGDPAFRALLDQLRNDTGHPFQTQAREIGEKLDI